MSTERTTVLVPGDTVRRRRVGTGVVQSNDDGWVIVLWDDGITSLAKDDELTLVEHRHRHEENWPGVYTCACGDQYQIPYHNIGGERR